jgi:hypothetical protein
MPKYQNDPVVSVSNSEAAAVQGENNAFEGIRLPIRRTKSPKAEFLGGLSLESTAL